MSADAFATLRPSNILARLAFSELYETFTNKRQNTKEDAPPALRRMVVKASQIFDSDVLRLRLEDQRRVSQNAGASDAETSESLPEPDSDTDDQHQELGSIWTGHYELRLEDGPLTPEKGYTAGKGPLENIPMDLLLCTKLFAQRHDINLRNPHARFNFFPEHRGFYIASSFRSQLAQVTVNGETVQRQPYALNQHSMIIRLDKLEYTFQWTDYAATKGFIIDRSRYVTQSLGGPLQVDFDMPTPLPNRRMMGRWTLGEALGAGAVGRVVLGTSSRGEVAAVKMMERTSKNSGIVDAEIQISREVTAFAENADEEGRILRVVEVLYSQDEKFSSMVAFDIVAVIVQPVTSGTLAHICGAKRTGPAKGMTLKAAAAFRDALLGLQCMHHGGWMHRDLKPTNIGLIGTSARAILLDHGQSARLQPCTVMKPKPGRVGTVGYLAPELEIEDYDHSIDIWAMGIILYELTYKYHPWLFALNPWRDRKENENLRPQFQRCYQEAIKKMMEDYNATHEAPTEGFIHLGALFVDMVRYRWAANNHAPRPDIDEVLNHPAWGPLLPDTPRVKRQR
ncbi:hypothetical protein MMC07_004620 [Pseudocyphellaria aurata]|nr:hypothetical protein [Pseudocyphellaria aurata]